VKSYTFTQVQEMDIYATRHVFSRRGVTGREQDMLLGTFVYEDETVFWLSEPHVHRQIVNIPENGWHHRLGCECQWCAS
jgi:hypothetical protein